MKKQIAIPLFVLALVLTSGALFPVFAGIGYSGSGVFASVFMIATVLFAIIKAVLEIAAAILVILACMKYLGIKFPRAKKTGSPDVDDISEDEQLQA
jgi:hypothetical protein